MNGPVVVRHRLYQKQGIWYIDVSGIPGDLRERRISLRTRDAVVAERLARETLKELEATAMRRAAGNTLRGLPLGSLQLLVQRLRESDTDSRGFVYVLFNPRAHRVKIGRSVNLVRRLSSLQGGSADPLELLLVLAGDKYVERSLHHRFASLRRIGEWFEVSWELVDWLEKERDNQAEIWAQQFTALPDILPQSRSL